MLLLLLLLLLLSTLLLSVLGFGSILPLFVAVILLLSPSSTLLISLFATGAKKLLIVLSILFLSISKSAVAVPAMLAAECFPYKKLQDIIINDHKENIFAAGINHGDMLLKIYLNKITHMKSIKI